MSKNFDITIYTEFIKDYLIEKGMISFWASSINLVVTLVLLGLLVLFLDIVLRKVIITSFKLFSQKTKTSFDDFLVQSKFPRYIAHIIPLYFFEIQYSVCSGRVSVFS